MNSKNCDFTTPCSTFLDSLADCKHYVNFIKWRLYEARERTEQTLNSLKATGNAENYFTGTGLPIVNVFHKGDYVTRAPSGKRITSGKNLIILTEEMERRFNANLISVIHERLADFLKAMYANMLQTLPHLLSDEDKVEFHRRQQGMEAKDGTPEYFRHYAKCCSGKDCSKAVAAMLKELPWDEVHICIWNGMTFDKMVGMLAFCRHCIVHEEGRTSPEAMNRLDKAQANFVEKWLFTPVHGTDPLILPDTQSVERAMEAFASFAYALYLLMSKRCGVDVEILFFERPVETQAAIEA
ncbi:MAG: hypothetical protein JWP89_841 [Schlesneria sp.]|nr:hypothetical protein [Schlesneria sp.]